MGEAKINENLLKFTGTLCLPEGLEIDEDFTFGVTAGITKREQRSNEDGTFNLVHTARLKGEAVVQTKYGKNIVLKTKSSPSKRFRSCMMVTYDGSDFSQHYETTINLLIKNWPEVKKFLEGIKDN